MSTNNNEGLYLGIDPGRCKTGLALVEATGKISRLYIAHTENLDEELIDFCNNTQLLAVVLGDGTNSNSISKEIALLLPGVQQYFVNEAFSTEEARKLYWQENPPKGLKKLIPLGLLVPPIPLDAYAAVVQVRRWLDLKK